MSYTLPQYNTAYAIMREAEEQIRERAGMNIRLQLQVKEQLNVSEAMMLERIANVLNMHLKDYKNPCRRRNFVELRYVATLMLYRFFPDISSVRVAEYFKQDHSTILAGTAAANKLLSAPNVVFLKKYNLVLENLEKWNGH